jgi:hypothetical protein
MWRFIAVLTCLALVVATFVFIVIPGARPTAYALGGVFGGALALLALPVGSVLIWPLFRLKSRPPYTFAAVAFAAFAVLALIGSATP